MRAAWRGVVTRNTETPNTGWLVSKGTKLRNLIEYAGRRGYWYADFYDRIGGNWLEQYICVSMKAVKVTRKTKPKRKRKKTNA